MKQSLKIIGFGLSIFFSSITQADPGTEAARKHVRAKFGVLMASARIGDRTQKAAVTKGGYCSPTPPNSPREGKAVRFLNVDEYVLSIAARHIDEMLQKQIK